jgi:hypothetical protein
LETLVYLKFNLAAEARKVAANRPTKVEPDVLLGIFADFYLERLEPATPRLGDSKRFLDRLFRLRDPR